MGAMLNGLKGSTFLQVLDCLPRSPAKRRGLHQRRPAPVLVPGALRLATWRVEHGPFQIAKPLSLKVVNCTQQQTHTSFFNHHGEWLVLWTHQTAALTALASALALVTALAAANPGYEGSNLSKYSLSSLSCMSLR